MSRELCALRFKKYLNVVPLAQMHRSIRRLSPVDFKVQNKEKAGLMTLDFEMLFFTVAHKYCGYLQQTTVNFKEK